MLKSLPFGIFGSLLITLAQPTTVSGQEVESALVQLPQVDLNAIRHADEQRARAGQMPHFAVGRDVEVTLWSHGSWRTRSADRLRWQLTVSSPDALSLSLYFERLQLPEGARLSVTSVASGETLGPLWPDSRSRLWTPPIAGAELRIQLDVASKQLEHTELLLSQVNHGYAGFGAEGPTSGSCEVDLACDVPHYWRELGQSVGLLVIEGVRFCSGFMLNNTELDGRPYFLTALHCGIDQETAGSVVVIWNHENRHCDGELESTRQAAFQSGATLRATHRPTDIALLELDEKPPNSWQVQYAGWDRSLTNPDRSMVIHHPNSDVKKIAFDHDRATTTRYLQHSSTSIGDYLRIGQWDSGTTEGGSSGAPLFDEDGRAVGVLRGGLASCEQDAADWFGRLSSAWTGASPDRGLGSWLDPKESGILSLESLGGVIDHRDVFERSR